MTQATAPPSMPGTSPRRSPAVRAAPNRFGTARPR